MRQAMCVHSDCYCVHSDHFHLKNACTITGKMHSNTIVDGAKKNLVLQT